MSIRAPIQGIGLRLGPEESVTTVAGLNDSDAATANRYYSPLSLPTTASLYYATGLEWLNGSVVSGDVFSQIERIDANPPVLANTSTVIYATRVAQTGVSVVQRNNNLQGTLLLPGGTLLAGVLGFSSATANYGTTTVASANNFKVSAIGTDPTFGNSTAWSASTEQPYFKLYIRPVL